MSEEKNDKIEEKEAQSEKSEKAKSIEQERLISESDTSNLEQKIEAILFMAAKAVSISDLQKLTNADIYSIKEAISNLQHWYASRKSWLEIVKVDKSYLMRLKPEYTEIVTPIVQETELSKRAIRVLAVVVKNNGILQSKIVKMLGTGVYDAVAELKQKGYVTTETKGHSKIIKLTQKFKTYFGEIPV
ncbi:MAG: SMC-Scp complex subunit ScpB [Candidatus Micrarchaeota archaeon]|nr:SMC-Scp complex subunit ScpB [Candidatus Micrarchaeota archaeon]